MPLLNQERWPLAVRYVKFCLVGASGVLVDLAVLYLLVSPQPSPLRLSLSKAVAAEMAILNNFTWNELWTFRSSAAQPRTLAGLAQRLLRFNVISLSGVLLNVALLNAQVYLLHWNLYVANLLAIGLVSIWNFALSARFGWKVR